MACGALVIVYGLLGLLSVTSNYATIGLGQGLLNDFRSELYAHLRRPGAHHERLLSRTHVQESALWGLAQRTLGAIRVIQAFTTEENEHRRFVASSRASLAAYLRLYTVQTAYSALVNLMIAAGTAVVLWYGATHPGATGEQVKRAAMLAQLDDFLTRLPDGLETMVGEGGATLSAGEQLRITIARALLRDAPLLILDEPTSALDVATEARVMRALETLTEGRTTFVIAHRLSTVRRADLIVVLQDGRVAEQGSFADLMASDGIFADLYRTQFGEEPDAAPPATEDA